MTGKQRRRVHKAGECIIIDTTYNTNKYGLYLTLICIENEHSKTEIVAWALTTGQKTEDYAWINNCFLDAVHPFHPKVSTIPHTPLDQTQVTLEHYLSNVRVPHSEPCTISYSKCTRVYLEIYSSCFPLYLTLHTTGCHD